MLDPVAELVRESNKIEGIMRDPTSYEIEATRKFLETSKDNLKPGDLFDLHKVYQPGAIFRNRPGLDVRVGNHIAPPGGPHIDAQFRVLLMDIMLNLDHPFILHQRYETLHPFTDGNGRTGRALWAWQMCNYGYRPGIALGFLHAWYYQSLEHADCRTRQEKADAKVDTQ